MFAFLLTVCFAYNTSCIKISTVGFEGSNLTPEVARDGMEHSAELADNCATTAENLSSQNPNAYVNCRITQEEMEVEYDPNPPPPPEPQYGIFYSTSWDQTDVNIISYADKRKQNHYHFTMRHGETRIIDLMPGDYVVSLWAANKRISVAFHVDNNHNDSTVAGQIYDFAFEVARF